jgi:hypothetical protein
MCRPLGLWRKSVLTEGYDPLSYENLARSVVQALLTQPLGAVPPEEPFDGPGVYALYYGGSFTPYLPIAGPESERPIYVGKAVPAGGRKGLSDIHAAGTALFRRLKDHAKSLEAAENLDIGDFRCRYLVVVPVWITLAERFLLAHYQPAWNTVIDGFGNHDPGKGRRNMRRPRWDILHPGRHWAQRLEPAETRDEVIAGLQAFLRE